MSNPPATAGPPLTQIVYTYRLPIRAVSGPLTPTNTVLVGDAPWQMHPTPVVFLVTPV